MNRFVRFSLRRSAFTLVELLVVIATLALLLALMLPSVGAVREAARKVECQNNIRQIGIATSSFESARRELPPSHVFAPAAHTWFAFILPFLEEGTLYDLMDFQANWFDEENQQVVNSRIEIMYCPSTPDGHRTVSLGDERYATVTDYSAPSYVASSQVFPRSSFRDRRGALDYNRGVRLQEVKDGMTHTVLAIEDAGRPVHWVQGELGPTTNVTGCENFDVTRGVTRGASWADPNNIIPFHGFDDDGLRCPGLCAINCTNNNEAYSFHPNVVVAVFLDGSVRFISEETDAFVYAATITRNAARKEAFAAL